MSSITPEGDIFKNASRQERFEALIQSLDIVFKEKLDEPTNIEDIKYTFENIPEDNTTNPSEEVACFINITPDLDVANAQFVKIVNSWAKKPGYPVYRLELYWHKIKREQYTIDPEKKEVAHVRRSYGDKQPEPVLLDIGMGFAELTQLLIACKDGTLVMPEEVSADCIAPSRPRLLDRIMERIDALPKIH